MVIFIDQALEVARRALAARPSFDARLRMGVLLRQAARFDELRALTAELLKMTPAYRQSDVKEMIEQAFGGVDSMLQKLGDEAVNHFASGWAWLVLDRDQLKITSLHDADTPLVHDGMVPLFTLDVWEHAYYIDYRNERPKFVTSVLTNIVNWDFVAQNLDGKGADRANQEGAAVREPEPTT